MEPDQAESSAPGATHICDEDFERALSQLLKPIEQGTPPESLAPIQDGAFIELSSLLKLHGDVIWSQRPRTYALLYLIRQRDHLAAFETQTDYCLPYAQATLPSSFRVPGIRRQFLKHQSLVLSLDAKVVQTPDEEHRHFQNTGDAHFAPLQELGHGGFGVVDKVWGRLSNRAYARKRFHKGINFDQSIVRMKNFENELHTLKKLSHHHLVKYIGSYTDPQFLALIMLPVAECNLCFWLEHNPNLLVLRMFFGCLSSVVAYLHRESVRHKDIKPMNILVSHGTVYLTDFGTALDWKELDRSTTSGDPGAFTRCYAAPEVLEHKPRGSPSDIFSLGCVFLEMATCLCGHPLNSLRQYLKDHGTTSMPFATNEEAVISWIGTLYSANIPETEARILEVTSRMLNHIPKLRPGAQELLESIFGTEPSLICSNCTHANDLLALSSPPPNSTFGEMDDTEGISRAERTAQTSQNKASSRNEPLRIPESLCRAAKDGNRILVQSLVTVTENIDYLDADGYTALMRAACHEDASITRTLLQHNADPFVAGEFDEDGNSKENSPLDLAVDNGCIEVLRTLVQHSRSRNLDMNIGRALHQAICNNDPKVVETLLALDADPDAFETYGEEKRSALYVSVLSSCRTISQALIRHGACLTVGEDSSGMTIAHAAILGGSESLMRTLLEHRLPVNIASRSGVTPLHMAVARGKKDFVELLLAANVDPNAITALGKSALLLAAQDGRTEMIHPLIVAGANTNLRNVDGLDAACDAARQGHSQFLERLLDEVDTKSIRDAQGWSPLDYAVYFGWEEAVDVLIRKTPGDVHHIAQKRRWAPFHVAVQNRYPSIVLKLLDHDKTLTRKPASDGLLPMNYAMLEPLQGTRVVGRRPAEEVVELLLDRDSSTASIRDFGYQTMLMYACLKDKPEIVRILLSRGADVKAKASRQPRLMGRTALHFAASGGSEDSIKQLLEKGIPVDWQDMSGYTALAVAAVHGRKSAMTLLQVYGKSNINFRADGNTQLMAVSRDGKSEGVQLLLEAGATMDTRNHWGETALLLAISKGHAEVSRKLLKKGCEANSKSLGDINPIMLASKLGHLEIVKHLIAKRVSLEERTVDGDTALLLAIDRGHAEVARILLEQGCEANAKNSKDTNPIMLASQLGNVDIVKHLIARKVSLEEQTAAGNTALSKAVDKGHLEVAKILVDSGANKEVKGGGCTPLYRAAYRGHKEIAEMLVKAGAEVERAKESAKGSDARQKRKALKLLRNIARAKS